MSSCILYQNSDASITLLDIPRSIELAQGSATPVRQLLSSKPLEQPFPSVEPKSDKARAKFGEVALDDLLLQKHLELALKYVKDVYQGDWCLPRVTGEGSGNSCDGLKRKREGDGYAHDGRVGVSQGTNDERAGSSHVELEDEDEILRVSRGTNEPQHPHLKSEQEAIWEQASSLVNGQRSTSLHVELGANASPDTTLLVQVRLEEITPGCIFHHNPHPFPQSLTLPPSSSQAHHIPPHTTTLLGPLHCTLPTFRLSAPKSGFHVITLDPPWPNRSASRSKAYHTPTSASHIYSLLSSIPISSHMAEGGLIGAWVTNKPAIREMILGTGDGTGGGLFGEWGVRLVEEWVWVKVTVTGEPVLELGSVWRRPWEVLLVGRKAGKGEDGVMEEEGNRDGEEEGVKRRVVLAVPDLHSRKPCLKGLFEGAMGLKEGEYEGLEIFARNLTKGWWSWGDEVLKFQADEHWV